MRNVNPLTAWLLCALAGGLLGCQKDATEWRAEPLTLADQFDVPMGAEVGGDGMVYISNIQTDQDDGYWTADAAGFISRLASDGRVLDPRWADSNPITFLNAPKGMCVLDEYLYVADINHVVRYRLGDPSTGQEIAIPNAKDLLDVTSDGQAIYVSDGGAARIHRIDPRSLEVTWIAAPARVAGIVYYPAEGAIYAASVQDHDIYKLDPAGNIPPVPLGLGDYLQRPASLAVLSDGSLVVADYDANHLLLVSPDRTSVRELAKIDSPGIIGLDAQRALLYVPQLMSNRVTVFQLVTRQVEQAGNTDVWDARPAAPPAPSGGLALPPAERPFGSAPPQEESLWDVPAALPMPAK